MLTNGIKVKLLWCTEASVYNSNGRPHPPLVKPVRES